MINPDFMDLFELVYLFDFLYFLLFHFLFFFVLLTMAGNYRASLLIIIVIMHGKYSFLAWYVHNHQCWHILQCIKIIVKYLLMIIDFFFACSNVCCTFSWCFFCCSTPVTFLHCSTMGGNYRFNLLIIIVLMDGKYSFLL